MAERWLPITGWEGRYEVSDHGRVRSLDSTDRNGRFREGRILRAFKNADGYPRIGLHLDGQCWQREVHALVAEAFIGPRPDGMEVCHGDGNPANAHVGNLRYGTHSENEFDKVRLGTHHQAVKTHCAAGHPFAGDNLYITPQGFRECRTCNREAARRYKIRKQQRLASAAN